RVQAGVTVKAPIISVDNKVYAKLPFSGWSELDPSDYGAPDPAALIAPKTGISSLFTKTQDPSADGSERQGKEVLTKIHGTLSGDAVHELFPSAATDEFDVTYTLTDDNTMSSVTITGPFYGDHGDITYTIDLDLSADPVTIKAPAL
ncbi:MAG: LppX_LprAFG lipoprotein, partial [Nocardioidaceae bacterium]